MAREQNPVQSSCPFCGSNFCETKYLGGQWQMPGAFESGWRGVCSDCGALTRAFPTEDEAATAWNTRVNEESPVSHEDLSEIINEIKDILERWMQFAK